MNPRSAHASIERAPSRKPSPLEPSERAPVNAELSRAQGACLAEPGHSAYEGRLGELDYGLRSDQLRNCRLV